jgi:hypothetical protein
MSMYGIDPEKTADVLDTHAEFAAATLMREMAARITTLEAQVATATPAPASDQAALVEKIAETLARADGWEWVGVFDRLSTPMSNHYRKLAAAARAAVLDDEAALIVRHCPDHGPQDQDGVWMDCHCAVADDMRKRATKALASEEA